MATRTTNLGLQKPGKGEFRDTWHVPMNANADTIDAEITAVKTEVENARFSKTSLSDFLAVGIETTGALKPTAEVESARNSFLYGNKAEPSTYFELNDLNDLRDREMWAARGGQADLRAGLAFAKSFSPGKVLSGSKDVNGNSNWTVASAASIGIDGSTVPVWMEIGGRLARCRTDKRATLPAGPSGQFYLYAEYDGTGVITVSGSGLSVSCGADVTSPEDIRIHEDTTKAYDTEDVKIGDLLRYIPPTTEVEGDYLIDMVAPTGQIAPLANKLRIKGIFPKVKQDISYQIIDPLAVTVGVTATPTPTANRLYLAEFTFDGTNTISNVFPLNFGDSFVGNWRAVNVNSPVNFEETWNHALGSDKLQVTVQVSQANDGTLPIEELSLAQLSATITGTVGGSLIGSTTGVIAGSPSVTLSSGGQTVTATSAGTLGFTSSGEQTFLPENGDLAVSATPSNSAIIKYSRNQVWVRNAVAGVFYTDYGSLGSAGTVWKTGFIRVIISKKG